MMQNDTFFEDENEVIRFDDSRTDSLFDATLTEIDRQFSPHGIVTIILGE